AAPPGIAPVSTEAAVEALLPRHFKFVGRRGFAEPVGVLAAPLDRTLQQGGAHAAQLSAGKEGSRVSIKLGWDNSKALERKRDGEPTPLYREWSLTASAPANDDGSDAFLATVSDFASDFELAARWASYKLGATKPADTEQQVRRLYRKAHENCRLAAATKARNAGAPLTSAEAEMEACHNGLRAEFAPGLVQSYLVEADRILLENLLAPPPTGAIFGGGVEARVGWKEHGFVDAASVVKSTEDHTPWGVKAFVGKLPIGSKTSYLGSVEYLEAYEDGDTAIVCPASTGGSVQCLSGALGAPEKTEKLVFTGEMRRLFFEGNEGLLPALAISAEASYDARSDEYSLDLPIYLVSGDDGLVGGVRIGYTSVEDETVAGVFVGTSFSHW
ncbi:MAG TPA: hypothetical protein VD906_01460, partial [Caulobacteraceae bacterium]|nr:hypothetical protein [Caulobacteraceae bacterium]